jgi:uncharacterized protein (DUF488 family)
MFAFFTVGHSTRSLEEFIGLLKESLIEIVIDVRTIPRSRTNPQYNSGMLATFLSEFGIEYEHLAALGGLRSRAPDVRALSTRFGRTLASTIMPIMQ